MNEKIEALTTAKDYINNLKKGISDLVENINAGQENNGINLIPQIVDGIDWVTQVISLTSDVHKGSVSVGDMNEKLEEIIEALDNEDYVLFSDLFNYELVPILDDIQESIVKVI